MAKPVERGGAPQLRWQMNNEIACLEYLRMSDRMGRKANYDEWADHILSLNIGMTKEELIPFDEVELPQTAAALVGDEQGGLDMVCD